MTEWWYAVVDGNTRLQARRTALMVRWVVPPYLQLECLEGAGSARRPGKTRIAAWQEPPCLWRRPLVAPTRGLASVAFLVGGLFVWGVNRRASARTTPRPTTRASITTLSASAVCLVPSVPEAPPSLVRPRDDPRRPTEHTQR